MLALLYGEQAWTQNFYLKELYHGFSACWKAVFVKENYTIVLPWESNLGPSPIWEVLVTVVASVSFHFPVYPFLRQATNQSFLSPYHSISLWLYDWSKVDDTSLLWSKYGIGPSRSRSRTNLHYVTSFELPHAHQAKPCRFCTVNTAAEAVPSWPPIIWIHVWTLILCALYEYLCAVVAL